MPQNDQRRLARVQKIQSLATDLSSKTHFNFEECKALISVHERITSLGKVDRLRFREFLHSCFSITDDIMLDLVFRAFDRNADGMVDDTEFVHGLSAMLRGDLAEITEFCYFVFDINGDRSLAREELYHCLKGCIYPGYGIDADEIDDAERDIVEIAMRKLDFNRDGLITADDFSNAVRKDPLLVQAIGSCLPTPSAMATFLCLVTDQYRAYSPTYADDNSAKPKLKSKLEMKINPLDEFMVKQE